MGGYGYFLEPHNGYKSTILGLRKTPAGEEYYEVSNKRGAVLATKNHQGGLDDQDNKSNGDIFERPDSKCCPLNLISKYLGHLNLESRSQEALASHSILSKMNCGSVQFHWVIICLNMLHGMTSRAGIQPYLTNHSIRATTVTVSSAGNNWSPKQRKY